MVVEDNQFIQKKRTIVVTKESFDSAAFLRRSSSGRVLVDLKPRDVFFTQGDATGSTFYLKTGRAKLTVVSDRGKEMILALLSPGDFLGEASLAPMTDSHRTTAVAVTHCTAIRIEKKEMAAAVSGESAFSKVFLDFLLSRSMRTQADLVDHLFNSSERRLARVLLLMAEVGTLGPHSTLIPHITQETLAEMIGTTRSRVSFFMNRFRKHGLIEYNGRIGVHHLLLKAYLDRSDPCLVESEGTACSRNPVAEVPR